MAKAMTKSQIVDQLATKSGVTKKITSEILDNLSTLAYKEAKNSFTVPGLGKSPRIPSWAKSNVSVLAVGSGYPVERTEMTSRPFFR